jgi:hypothetical protein
LFILLNLKARQRFGDAYVHIFRVLTIAAAIVFTIMYKRKKALGLEEMRGYLEELGLDK